MKKNWLTTVGGIMAGMTGVPVILGVSHIAIPNWLNVALFVIGAIGTVVTGVAAKGQDEHSVQAQVQAATIEHPDVQAKAIIEAKVAAVEAPLTSKVPEATK